MSIPHPFPYQGSKRRIAATILRCFPDEIDTLYEPFCGSAAITIAAAYGSKARRFVINDSNGPLMTLWEWIIERPLELVAGYRHLWEAQTGQEKEYYFQVREQFNQTHRPDYFLYLLARCVKAAVRYNAAGDFNQSLDNRRRGMRPTTMQDNILATSRLLAGKISLQSVDYRKALATATPRDLVYMDPPYQGVGGRNPRYLEYLPYDDFVATLAELNRNGIAFIVSYDGKNGTQKYGRELPTNLALTQIKIDAGRSAQATLLGRNSRTTESLYLSPALMTRLEQVDEPEQLGFRFPP